MADAIVKSNQFSPSDWFAAIGKEEASNAFREEDHYKAKRLETLFQVMGVPYERPEILPARELTDMGPRFQEILESRGDALCAIRLVPEKPELSKLRQRGASIRDTYEKWFKAQTFDPDEYTAHIYPHSEMLLWSATFIVSDKGIYGEIIRGLHNQLTHGLTEHPLTQFYWDFTTWRWSSGSDPEAAHQVPRMIGLLKTDDANMQAKLREDLHAEFVNGYLKGYFESTIWPDNNVYLIDYNRILPAYFAESITLHTQDPASEHIAGVTASSGCVSGRARVLLTPENAAFEAGDILICDMTDVRYLPFMKLAGGIVTDRGGILSHAAIVSRELKKPCIIGTKNATRVLKDGDEVEVDADHGIVRTLKRANGTKG